jgi:hypothetical protein
MEDSIATVTIREAHRMTPQGRKAIAAWLREKADDLVSSGHEYADKFTARYFARKQNPKRTAGLRKPANRARGNESLVGRDGRRLAVGNV